MGQKDLTAKELESRQDVFADIINALIYEGEQVILPQMLQTAPTETLYAGMEHNENGTGEAADSDENERLNAESFGTLRNQYNDVSKYEMAGSEGRADDRVEEHKYGQGEQPDRMEYGHQISKWQENVIESRIKIQYILENESGENYRLLLRKAGYEGAIYRNEYENKRIYPVVILVLYWGEKKWKTHFDMHGLFAKELDNPVLKKYVDNIRLHIFPMAHLPEEVRQRFKSDMRIVVDYLAEGKAYKPTGQRIKHIGAVMRLLYALTGEKELESILAGMQEKQEKGEELVMKEYYTTFFANQCRQEGRQIGREEGRKEGKEEGRKEGREEGREEGRKEGKQQGIKQGIDKLSNLISQLIEKGREEDMRRSLKDKEYQEELFKEFGL